MFGFDAAGKATMEKRVQTSSKRSPSLVAKNWLPQLTGPSVGRIARK